MGRIEFRGRRITQGGRPFARDKNTQVTRSPKGEKAPSARVFHNKPAQSNPETRSMLGRAWFGVSTDNQIAKEPGVATVSSRKPAARPCRTSFPTVFLNHLLLM